MRSLLGENMPPQFRHSFPGHEVRSAQFMGWLGRHNGEVVRLGRDTFDVTITKDRTIERDARPTPEDVGLIILVPEDQGIPALSLLVPQILDVLQTTQRGRVRWVPPQAEPRYIRNPAISGRVLLFHPNRKAPGYLAGAFCV